jgi:nucleotide-binding universal stress UspA family protein
MPAFQFSGVGIALAAIFLVGITALMVWMFRVPRPVGAEVAKARRSLDVARLILVPTTGVPYSQRAVELACRLAQEHAAEILLVYVIEVPRTLQLDVPLDPAERAARQALDTAREVVRLHDLPVRTLVHRARDAGNGIISAAQDHHADLIVMGIVGGLHGHVWGRTAETLLHRAPCEVIFDKLPER